MHRWDLSNRCTRSVRECRNVWRLHRDGFMWLVCEFGDVRNRNRKRPEWFDLRRLGLVPVVVRGWFDVFECNRLRQLYRDVGMRLVREFGLVCRRWFAWTRCWKLQRLGLDWRMRTASRSVRERDEL